MISISNISKEYEKNNLILDNISLSVKEGDYCYIIGPNGGGKTTLIKILLGIIKQTSGTYQINSDKIGYLPQMREEKKDFPISVYEVIMTGLSNIKIKSKKETFRKVTDLLELMEISHLKYKKITNLSGGELQRVYFVRMLISEPKVLFLDEPTSAIDPDFREKLKSIIDDYKIKNNATVIHITHDLDNTRKGRSVYYVDKNLKEL